MEFLQTPRGNVGTNSHRSNVVIIFPICMRAFVISQLLTLSAGEATAGALVEGLCTLFASSLPPPQEGELLKPLRADAIEYPL